MVLAPQIPLFVMLLCLMGGGGAAETINRIGFLSVLVFGSILVLGLKGCLDCLLFRLIRGGALFIWFFLFLFYFGARITRNKKSCADVSLVVQESVSLFCLTLSQWL